MLKRFTLLTCCSWLLFGLAVAQTSEDFNYTADTPLVGLGSAADGWAGPWMDAMGSNATITMGGLSNPALEAGTSGNKVSLTATSALNQANRMFAAPRTESFWFSSHVATDGPVAGTVGNVIFLDDAGNNHVILGKRFGQANVFATGAGTGAQNTGVQFAGGGEAVLLVGFLEKNAMGWSLDLWVNPDPGTTPQEADANIANKQYADAPLAGASVRIDGTGTGLTWMVDDLYTGDTFMDIIPTDLVAVANVDAVEDFNYDTGDLAGKGDMGDMWTGPWMLASDTGNGEIVDGGLVNETLLAATSGNRAQLTATGALNQYNRMLNDPLTESFWFSTHVATTGPAAGTVGNVIFLNDAGGNHIVLGKRFGQNNVFATGIGTGAQNTGVQFAGDGTAVYLVGFAEKNDNGWALDLWVNPDPTVMPDEADANIANKQYNDATLTGVSVRIDGGGTELVWDVDDIYIGDSFTDIIPQGTTPVSLTDADAVDTYNDYTPGDLIGQGGSDDQWAGPWQQESDTDSVAVVTGGLQNMQLLAETSGNHAEWYATGQTNQSVRYFDSPIDTTDNASFWFSSHLAMGGDAGGTIGNLILTDTTGGLTNDVIVGKQFGNRNIFVTGTAGGGNSQTGAMFQDSSAAFVVGHMTREGGQWLLDVWINPDPAMMPQEADANVQNKPYNAGNFHGVSVRVGGTGTALVWKVDDIYIGDSFDEVVPGDLEPIVVMPPVAAIAVEKFDYPVGEELFGQDGGAGFTGAWFTDSDTSATMIAAGGLVNDQLSAATTGPHLQMLSTGVETRAIRYLDTPIDTAANADFWFSSHLAAGGDATGNIGNLILFDTFAMNDQQVIVGKRFADRGIFATGAGGGGATGAGVSFEGSSAAFLVGHMTRDTGVWSLDLWVNPDPGMTPDEADAAIQNKAYTSGNFNAVGYRVGGGAGLVWQADDLYLGDVFADVVPDDFQTVTMVSPATAEKFDYMAGDSLVGQDGGTGWASEWLTASGPTGNAPITSPGLTNFELLKMTSSNKVTVQDAGRAMRALADGYGDTGRTYWMSYHFRTGGEDGYIANLVLTSADGFPNDEDLYLQVGKSFNGANLNIPGGGGGQPGANTDSTNLIVLEIVTNGTSAADQVYVWVNPGLDEQPGRDSAFLASKNLMGWNAVGLRVGTAGGDPVIEASWDDILLGNVFGDVVPDDLMDVQAPDVPVAAVETFDYDAGQDLGGLNGGEGWANAWEAVDGSITIGAGEIDSDRVDSEGNHAVVSASGSAITYERDFFTAYGANGAGEVWMSFLMNVTNKDVGNGFQLALVDANDETEFSVGAVAGIDNLGISYNNGANSDNSATASVVGNPVWVVLNLQLDGGDGDDIAYVWVNPIADALPDPANATYTVTDLAVDGDGFGTLRVSATGVQNLDALVDEIRTGFSFRDVSNRFGSDDPDLVAYEPFNYDVGLDLVGLGGINAFWDGTWENIGNLASNETEIMDGSVSYGDLETQGNRVQFRYQEDNSQMRISRPLAFPLEADGRTYWLSFFMESVDGDLTNNVGNVMLRNTAVGNKQGQIMAFGRLYGDGELGAVTPQTSNNRSSGVADEGLNWIVAKMQTDADAANPDSVWMWINPSLGSEPDTADAVVFFNTNQLKGGIDEIMLKAEGAGGDQQPYTVEFDEVRLATAWESVRGTVTGFDAAPSDPFAMRAFPNPTRDELTIQLDAPQGGRLQLTIHDTQGREVTRLADGNYPAGAQTFRWTVESQVPNGFYFLRVVQDGRSSVRKVIVYRR